MTKRERYSWNYWLIIFAIFMGMQVLFFPSNQGNKELSYNVFLDTLQTGEIERLVIFQDKIIGQFKEHKDTTNIPHKLTNAPSTPWRLRIPDIETQVKRQFIVTRIPNIIDDHLLEELNRAGVDYKGQFENNSLRNFFLNWILPFIIMMAIWGFLFRKMGPGNPMINLGKKAMKMEKVPTSKTKV